MSSFPTYNDLNEMICEIKNGLLEKMFFKGIFGGFSAFMMVIVDRVERGRERE